ncbi:MAG: M6 family metalloprotease domain-containing protein [Burkholderiales bacterium]|nr:M6 family metalloprotease domain-containing protein [Burkholderiales bacterium]
MTAPFIDEQFTFTNPDGSTIEVKGTGNQYYATFETLDGYTVVKDPQTGFYTYAHLSSDKSELLPVKGKIEEVDPQNLGIRPHIKIRKEQAKQNAQNAAMLQGQPARWKVRRNQKKAALAGITPTARAEAAMGTGLIPAAAPTVGNYKGLCILIKFPDVASSISVQEVDDFCNKPGYSGFGNNGSVRDYFHENSLGRLTYTNVITEYYTASNNRDYYTDPSISFGTRARELIEEALDDLASRGFNFDQLTSDDGGFIYALNVFYVGGRVNNWSEGLWPHQWSLGSSYDVGGGKKFFDYQITNMGSSLTLRTFCHENGHMICNFPDLYDYGGESSGVGHYCLMCNGGNDRNPVHVGAYLKNEAGWAASLTTITAGMNASLVARSNNFYIHSKNATEYFIIENRQATGRDAFLPDSGLAIWHIDETGNNSNEQMTTAMHYECSIMQADNRFDLENNTNRGDGEDLYSATNNTQFSDSTSPDAHWWDGSNSGLNISQISASGNTMTFKASGLAGWIFNKKVRYTSGHTNTKWAHAIIEDVSGWRQIAANSSDGVTNVLNILDAANANDRRVNVYYGTDGKIYSTYMS